MVASLPYRDLVKLASQIDGIEAIDHIEERCDGATARFVRSNLHLLQSAREVLKRSCSTPLRYDKTFYSEHMDDISHIRGLARALHAEATVAIAEKKFYSAVNSGLALIELANAARRGGLITSMLVGVAIEGMGFDVLRKFRADLSRELLGQLASGLETCEREREGFDAISTRDREWERSVFQHDSNTEAGTAIEELRSDIDTLSQEEENAMSQVLELAELPREQQLPIYFTNDLRMIAMSRLLRIDLAIREYLIKRSSLPESVQDLPSLLDPFTERPFVYRQIGVDSFLLYSPGPTEIDHGGQFGGWPWVAAGEADYCIDAADYWPRPRPSITETLTRVVAVPALALRRWLRRN